MDSILLILFNEQNEDWRKEDRIFFNFLYEEAATGSAL